MGELQRILNGVLLLHVSGTPAVLKIVDSRFAVEVVVDTAKIQPLVRHLMDEQRPGVEVIVAVDRLVVKGRGPLPVSLGIDGKSGRSQRENIQDERLAIAC